VCTVEPVDRVEGPAQVPADSVPVGIVAAAAGKPGLLADAEPQDGDGARLRAANRFQVYPGEARRRDRLRARSGFRSCFGD